MDKSTMVFRPFSIIVAYASTNRGIGYRGGLPWPKLRSDMARFRRLTLQNSVIIGRHTFDGSGMNGQPLPGRRNVIMSFDSGWAPPAGAVRAAHWFEALQLAHGGFGARGYDDGAGRMELGEATDEREVFVIGGQQIYEQAICMPFCTHVFATEVSGDWKADTFFPPMSEEWRQLTPGECPKAWASDRLVYEKGVELRFVTFSRV